MKKIIRFFIELFCSHKRTSEVAGHNSGWTSDESYNYPIHFRVFCDRCGKEFRGFTENERGVREKIRNYYPLTN